MPNDIIGSGGLTTTICFDPTSIDNNNEENNLLTVFPNPASNRAIISFLLSKSQKASIRILNVSGRLVSTLADKVFEEGENELKWNLSEINSGIYFLQFQSYKNIQTEKLIVIK